MAHPAGNEGIRKDGNTPRRATHPAAGNKDAPPHGNDAAGRRGRR